MSKIEQYALDVKGSIKFQDLYYYLTASSKERNSGRWLKIKEELNNNPFKNMPLDLSGKRKEILDTALGYYLNLTKNNKTLNELIYPIGLNYNDCELSHSIQFQNFTRSHLSLVDDGFDNDRKTLIKMRRHQEMVKRFMVAYHSNHTPNKTTPLTPYRGLLLYHDMGTGKTLTGIHLLVNFIQDYRLPLLKNMNIEDYQSKNEGKVYLMFYNRLKPTWMSELKRYLLNYFDLRYYFDHYFQIDKHDNHPVVKDLFETVSEDSDAFTLTNEDIKNIVLESDMFSDGLKNLIATSFIEDHIKIINCDPTISLINKVTSETNQLNHNLVVIDEIHNVISYIYSSINPLKIATGMSTKIGRDVYQWLMSSNDTKIVGLTGTPIINNYEELLVLANILRGPIMTETGKETLFDLDPNVVGQLIYDENNELINPIMLMRRLNGLISRKIRESNTNDYPVTYWDEDKLTDLSLEQIISLSIGKIRKSGVNFSELQYQFYTEAKKREKRSTSGKRGQGEMETSMTTSQGLCTFVLDRTFKYQINTEQFLKRDDFKTQQSKQSKQSQQSQQSIDDVDIEDIVEQEGGYIDEDEDEDEELVEEYESKDVTGQQKTFSYTRENMVEYAPKIAKMFETILDPNNEDLHFIYTRWVIYGAFHIEGYLQAYGYQPYLFDMGNLTDPNLIADRVAEEIALLESKIKEGYRYYVKYTDVYDTIVDGKKSGSSVGGLKDNELNQVRVNTINHIFCHNANKTGKLIKVLIGTRKAEEGLDLRNIRQVYIVEPWWNMVKPEQAMGRAIRYLSHYRKVKKVDKSGKTVEITEGFPEVKDRYVKIDLLVAKMSDSQGELYLKSTNSSNSLTTDEIVLNKSLVRLSNSIRMQNILNQSAIDCGIFSENNNLPCSNYFGVNETGYCFHSLIRNELVDNDFNNYRKIKRVEFKEITINNQKYLKENQAQNIYIKFEYQNQIYIKLADLILYTHFSTQNENNRIIIPAKAYVKEGEKCFEIDYPCFQIISI